MPRQDFSSHRLFIGAPLPGAQPIELAREQANYLLNVLRLQEGTELMVFNGADGEWRARLELPTRKTARLAILRMERPQSPPGEIWYCFAPLKAARLDYMVQKAVEMGAGRIVPMLTRHTQVARLNLDRLRANVIEAAEQCGVLAVPETTAEIRFEKLIETMPPGRRLVFCDEDAEISDPVAALRPLAGQPLALLIGPEGGFAAEERALLLARPETLRISLGPRILRADTAGVAALALIQAVCGDWR